MTPCLLALLAAATAPTLQPAAPPAPRQAQERTSFQAAGHWDPRVQVEADVAMVYGITGGFPERVASWKARGYRIHLMTGVAWGQYQDYFEGRYDGTPHHAESQTEKNGRIIGHGPGVPYVSPGPAYGDYLAKGVLAALDAGAEAVHLEEPEFWVRGGWEDGFKSEWRAAYGEDWQAPDSSPTAQWRASKLKYTLYRRALAQVFDAVHAYAKDHGRAIPCYVPTHSLLNYAHWRIVSPESSLLSVGCDGYIAQVWTGTSRTPNVYQGSRRERTFDTAFLEYGAMQNLVQASGRRMWFLNDPIEDNPNHTWDDYRANWESTLTASLLQPEIARYEIMPWPQRIYKGKYASGTLGGAKDPAERVPMPAAYETELAAVTHALGEMMDQPADQTSWVACGTRNVGILISDTMMFQRAGPGESDPDLGSFYGLALPLLKRGLPVEPIQIENAPDASPASGHFLDHSEILLLTYEGQKPPTAGFHEALAAWVKRGHALIIVDDRKDPFNAVPDWWNTAPLAYAAPLDHLLERLAIAKDAPDGVYRAGRGSILLEHASPAGLSRSPDGGRRIADLTRRAAESLGTPWKESPLIALRRGSYVIAAGLEEPATPTPPPPTAPDQPFSLRGRFLPLFDPTMTPTDRIEPAPGARGLWIDLDRLPTGKPRIAAAACAIENLKASPSSLTFRARGTEGSHAVLAITGAGPDPKATAGGQPVELTTTPGLLRISFTNRADGVDVEVRW